MSRAWCSRDPVCVGARRVRMRRGRHTPAGVNPVSGDSWRRVSSIQVSEMSGASNAAPLEVRRVSCVSRVALEAVTVVRAASVLARVGATLRLAHGGPLQRPLLAEAAGARSSV